jgi:hypothetical protein
MAVCNLCFVKNDNAKYHKRKTEDGRPVFQFSVSEAKDMLGISNKTLATAIKQLVEHGLIDWYKHGGLKGANGTASYFTLSKRWHHWEPVGQHYGRTNIQKARAARSKRK